MDKFLVRKSKLPSTSEATSTTAIRNISENIEVAIDKNTELSTEISQTKLSAYPKNDGGRSFHKEWFDKFQWLEYSVSVDAAFCFPCRQFISSSKETSFTSSGYRNWKSALETNKGFYKHEASASHKIATTMWKEKLSRQCLGKEVSTIVNNEVLERNRYYITAIAEVLQFLVKNELPMRGTYNIDESTEDSLFRNLFEYTMKKDTKLADICKTIPKNAHYLSPEIQNQFIQTLADCVSEDIVNDIKCADVPFFTLLEDGTKDKNGRENIAIGIRFVKDGKVNESILCIKNTINLDAQTFSNLTLNVLKECGLSDNMLLSQCYDGASVMSGKDGGVQALIQKKLNRTIPYVHCSNHRLHLVVVKLIKDIHVLKDFFEQCSMLYSFFKQGAIAKIYEGHNLSRLLEQRWSGHLQVTKIIYDNYRFIIAALQSITKSNDFSGDQKVEAIGLYKVIITLQFRFLTIFMFKVLKSLEPADKALQTRETSLTESTEIVEATKEVIKQMRNDLLYNAILQECTNEQFEIDSCNLETFLPQKRHRKQNSEFQNFVVYESLGHPTEEIIVLKSTFYDTIDVILVEFERRFGQNRHLIASLAAAENLSYDNIDFLKTFNITVPTKEEINVARAYLKKLKDPDIFKEMHKQKEAFEDTYKMLAAVKTFGCSTALCESTFSVLTRINRPQRLAMTHQRLANLTFLAFEKKRTENVDMQKVLQKFNNVQNRRLQLF